MEGGIGRSRLRKFYESLKSVAKLKGNRPRMVGYLGISQKKKKNIKILEGLPELISNSPSKSLTKVVDIFNSFH